MSSTLHSFDVFDTLITRRVFCPEDLFLLHAATLRRAGAWGGSDEGWQQVRIAAEQAVRARQSDGEVCLRSIYEELTDTGAVPPELAEKVMAEEVTIEARNATSIECVRRSVERLHASGSRVVFVSDMYLPEDAVRRMLSAAAAPDVPLYLSCALQATKRSGRLFDVVVARERVRAHDVLHVGDHAHSDVRVPARLGMRTRPFLDGRATARERSVYESSYIPCRRSRSLIAGAMRAARLGNPHDVESAAGQAFELGCEVSGPLMFAFASWLLEQATGRGIERLYFIARDGQLPCRVAQRLVALREIPIDCRYLYGSRQAWHLPALEALDAPSREWILRDNGRTAIRAVLERVGLVPSECARQLADSRLDPDEPLGTADAEHVWQFVRSCAEPIREAAARHRALVQSYLIDQGMTDDVRWAVVDIGWRGRLQRSLSSLLASVGASAHIQGFYLGLTTRPPPDDRHGLDAYLFDSTAAADWRIRGHLALYEMLFAATHAGVAGYARKPDGTVHPLLQPSYPLRDGGWPIDAHQCGVLRFVDELGANIAELDVTAAVMRPTVIDLLAGLFRQPTLREAELIGRAAFSEEQTEASPREIAPVARGHRLLRMLGARAEARHRETLWVEGSIRRRGDAAATLLLRVLHAATAMRG
jgi:predicted HAD superfamily hydrolase